MALFKNPGRVKIMIGAFIILFIGFVSCEVRASETTFEAAAPFIKGEFSNGTGLFQLKNGITSGRQAWAC